MVKRVTALMIALVVTHLLQAPAWADCQVDGVKAQMVLLTFKQDALSGKRPDQAKFKSELNAAINNLKQGQCMNELTGLLSFIQGEQKTYPNPSKSR